MPQVDNEVKGRLALITGASGGIGGACARELFAQGIALALTYSKSKDAIDKLVWELEKTPSWAECKVSVHQADMASQDDIQRIFVEIKKEHGKAGPDILVSNAGFGKRIPNIADIGIDDWDITLTINLRAAFILSKLSIEHMTQQKWGRIIYIGSLAAYGGGINGCHYAASKAGLQGMMRNLARKHAKDGITVNDVAPAMIGDTGMIPDEKTVEGTPGDVKNIPVGRLGTPLEVANLVTTLVKTGYMTGQSLLLSGGLM